MKQLFTSNKKSGFNIYINTGYEFLSYLLFLYIGIILIIGGIFLYVYFSTNQFDQISDFIDITTLGYILANVLGPLIALIAALLTFGAFMVQIQANQQQREQFEKQFVDQQKSNFETRFFELLKIHRENVNNIDSRFEKKNGFEMMFKELEYIYVLQFDTSPSNSPFVDFLNSNTIGFRDHPEWVGDCVRSSDNKDILDNLWQDELKAVELSVEIFMKGNLKQILYKYQLRDLNVLPYIHELMRLESIKIDISEVLSDKEEYLKLIKDYKENIPEIDLKKIQRRYIIFQYPPVRSAYEITIDLINNKYSLKGYSELITPYFSNLLYLIEYVDKNLIVIHGKEDDDETKKENIAKVKEEYFKLINLQMSRYELYLLYYFYLITYFGDTKQKLIKASKILESITDAEINFSIKPWYLFKKM